MPLLLAIIAIVAVIGVGGYILQSNNPTTTTETTTENLVRPEDTAPPAEPVTTTTNTPPTASETPVTETPTPPTAGAETFTARGEYLTPARTTHVMDVTLTVTDGVVTDASIVYDEGAGFGSPHHERFDGAYKAQVIGKRLDQINLSRVGGASLTSRSFNEIVDKIEAQVQA